VRRIAAIVVLIAVLLVLGVAQLVLPGIAAQRIRTRLSAYGSVRSVRVHAFPAVELLWHHADRIDIALASYRSGSGQVGSLLHQLTGVDALNVSADQLDIGLLRLRDAALQKRGSALSAGAVVSEADLRAAVPFLDGVVPVASTSGTLTLQGSATVFGLTASAQATVGVQAGALVVSPDVPFGGLATVTLFSDPHVDVEGVAATAAPSGFSVSARGVLR
jgi:hypothetical protein